VKKFESNGADGKKINLWGVVSDLASAVWEGAREVGRDIITERCSGHGSCPNRKCGFHGDEKQYKDDDSDTENDDGIAKDNGDDGDIVEVFTGDNDDVDGANELNNHFS